jgi:hypothetical protein
MVDHFHHRGEVALLLEFARFDPYEVKKFVGVDEVEIPGEGQVTRWDGISFDKRVAEFGQVLSVGTVPEVTKQQFADERDIPFHQAGMFGNVRLILLELLEFAHDPGEDIRDRLMVAAPDAVEEGVPGFNVELDGGYSGAILAAVVLFFHQQVQLVQAKEDGTVLLEVIRERFS